MISCFGCMMCCTLGCFTEGWCSTGFEFEIVHAGLAFCDTQFGFLGGGTCAFGLAFGFLDEFWV